MRSKASSWWSSTSPASSAAAAATSSWVVARRCGSSDERLHLDGAVDDGVVAAAPVEELPPFVELPSARSRAGPSGRAARGRPSRRWRSGRRPSSPTIRAATVVVVELEQGAGVSEVRRLPPASSRRCSRSKWRARPWTRITSRMASWIVSVVVLVPEQRPGLVDELDVQQQSGLLDGHHPVDRRSSNHLLLSEEILDRACGRGVRCPQPFRSDPAAPLCPGVAIVTRRP